MNWGSDFSYVLLGLITLIGWGSGDIFTVLAVRRINAYLTVFWIFLLGVILTSFYIPFAPNNLSNYSVGLLLVNLVLGVFYVGGNFLITEAFNLSSASLVGVIIQSFPAIVLVASALIYKTPITLTQWLLVGVVFLGVFLCSVDLKELKDTGKLIKDQGVKLALLAAVLLSIYFTALPELVNRVDWFWPNYIASLTFPVLLLVMRRKKIKLKVPKKKIVLFFALMVALLIRSGDIALNYGLSVGAGAIVAPLSGAAPILFVILSSIIFKDKINKQQKLGILTTLLGIVLLNTLG